MKTSPAVTQLLQLIRLDARPSEIPPLDAGTAEALLPLVRYESIVAWFGHRLHQNGGLTDTVPMHGELRRQGLIQAASYLKLAVVVVRVMELFASHGIRAVLLKGVAYCALQDRYPFFRWRSTVDADLLIEPGSSERAWQLLLDTGMGTISPIPSVHPDHHHHPTLISDLNVPVEIHSSASLFWSDQESWRRLNTHASELIWRGCPVRVPEPTELFWHGVVHSLGDGPQGCRLRSFLTAAALLVDGGELDWDRMRTRMERDRIREHDSRQPVPAAAVRRWLSVAAWLGGIELPAGMADDSVRERLVRLLEFRRRKLAAGPLDVSQRVEQWIGEAARAEVGLGLARLGRWQPRSRQPKRLLSSLLYRLLYWTTR